MRFQPVRCNKMQISRKRTNKIEASYTLEGSCVWDPQDVVLQQEIEKVQNRAARFVTSNYCFETGSMTGILEKLKSESLKKKEERQKSDSFVQRSKGCCQHSNR